MDFLTVQGLLGIVVLVAFIFASTYIPTCKIQVIHETSLTVILGFLGGILIKEKTGTFVGFDDRLFFYYILPLILFAEGYTMKHRQFFRNIGSIIWFGVVGTVICFLVNCYGAYLICEYGTYIGLDQKLTFTTIIEIGAVLSESDTVAAIAVISERESPQVRSILLGEGVVNDAVAIVLFHSAMHLGIDSMDYNAATLYLSELAFMCGISILMGLLCGILSALITRNFRLLNSQPHHEVALLFLLAYLGYILSMMLGASGVLAILTTAIMMAHYSWYNISEEARFLSKGAFHVLGEITEAFVYVYIGFSAYEHFTEIGGFRMMLALTAVVLISRFVAVVLLPGIFKICCRKMTLKMGELMAIWFAGSIRGAVAFALITASEESPTK